MVNRVWVLGAQDPEMQAIEKLLLETNQLVGYALVSAAGEEQKRVLPSQAYKAQAFSLNVELNPDGYELIEVECKLHNLDCTVIKHIDHHFFGDSGYGVAPEDFLEASSLGQVIIELGKIGALPSEWDWFHALSTATKRGIHRGNSGTWLVDNLIIPHDLVIAAACDHCLGAAWAGKCPEVNRDDVKEYRARLASTRPVDPVSVEIYNKRFNTAIDLIKEGSFISLYESGWMIDSFDKASESEFLQSLVLDARSEFIPELPDAACYLGISYLSLITERDGRKKVVLGGNTTPELVKKFMEVWAPKNGLTDIYGDPVRGFAGGYIKI
jgi:hypothetical protein